MQTLGVEYSPLHGTVLGKDFPLGNGGVGRNIFKHPGADKIPFSCGITGDRQTIDPDSPPTDQTEPVKPSTLAGMEN